MVAEFLKPARFSGAVPSRYVVMSEGKIEYFAEKDRSSMDPLKGSDFKGFINLYEYKVESSPRNPLMLNFVRSDRNKRKSNNPEVMPSSTRVSVDMANHHFISSLTY